MWAYAMDYEPFSPNQAGSASPIGWQIRGWSYAGLVRRPRDLQRRAEVPCARVSESNDQLRLPDRLSVCRLAGASLPHETMTAT